MNECLVLVHYNHGTESFNINFDTVKTLQQFMKLVNESSNGTIAYCEFEDEEGDRLAVKSDEEFRSMASYLLHCKGGHIYPIKKEPKLDRKPVGLRIDTGIPRVEPIDELEDVQCLEELMGDGLECGTVHQIFNQSELKPHLIRNLCILGSGHAGTVYKAVDTQRDRLMAVKCVSLDVGPEVQSSILNELRILNKCSNENIVEFYGAMFVESQISICMEFMDGGSLDGYGAIPESILSHVAVAIVRGLSYLWSVKVMHRDIKPSNILVNSEGCVKLCDFGVSAQLQQSIASSYVGTNAYMAPERIMGGEYRVHSDIWSLGMTLLELGLGWFPLKEELRSEPMELIGVIVSAEPLSIPTLHPNTFSSPFRNLVQLCLMKEPRERIGPVELTEHELILAHTPYSLSAVSAWIQPLIQAKRPNSATADTGDHQSSSIIKQPSSAQPL